MPERAVDIEPTFHPDVYPPDIEPSAEKLVEAVEHAAQHDLNDPPKLPIEWSYKTNDLVSGGWEDIPPPARRVMAVLSNLGQILPECATLEAIMRGIATIRSFDLDRAIATLTRFQRRSQRAGSAPLIDFAAIAPLLLPAINSIRAYDEREALLTVLPMLPAFLVGSASSRRRVRVQLPDGSWVDVDLDGYGGKGWTIEHHGFGSASGHHATPEELKAARLQQGADECRRRNQHQPKYSSPTQSSCARCGEKLW